MIFNRCFRYYLACALVIILSSGCSSKYAPMKRQQNADQFSMAGGMIKQKIATENFILTTYQRFNDKADDKELVVYIEGDGMAWVSRSQLSANPTPVNPVALELASLDNRPNVLYIARPCQYLWPESTTGCSSEYWSNKRGSEEAIIAINEVISIVKNRENVPTIKLIGYSGGGAIAAIISARRDDVVKLVTVSGNLNYQLFTNIHNLSPMTDSVNPIAISKKIRSIPQIHYVGADDKIVPEQIARSFSDRVEVVKGVTHDSWPEVWKDILLDLKDK